MAMLNRRQLLGRGATAGLGAALATGLAPALAPVEATAARGHGEVPGPLRGDPARLLALPPGFRYLVVSRTGSTRLVTGQPSPERPDGMGAFAVEGQVRLVQNHEIKPGRKGPPVPPVAGTRYDAGILGGGCTIIETTRNGRRLSEWVGLSGTVNNCAGGITPWGTWLSCEETEDRAGTAYRAGGTSQRDHGFVFEVAPAPPREQRPVPVRAWGRFPHEAVVVASDRAHVFLTEDVDDPNGLLYRWTAPAGRRLRRGALAEIGMREGRLQALRVVAPDGGHLDDLSRITSQYLNRPVRTAWVEVPDRLAADTPVRKQFRNDQVTRSSKLEGAFGDRSGFFFDASYAHPGPQVPAGSVPHDGQVWRYDYRTEALTLRAYFPYVADRRADGGPTGERGGGVTLVNGPDNLTGTPWGGLVIAEDGVGANHLLGWTERTGAWPLARNEVNRARRGEAPAYSEMAGPTFSPLSHRVLFANVYDPGVTFAIAGPFERYFG